jgi:hypothetical protein
VHGVADQDEKETGRQAARLLLGEHLSVDYETVPRARCVPALADTRNTAAAA